MTGRGSPVPLALRTDLVRGGRWTSLSSAGREWLWTNPDPEVASARSQARPGDPFVDAGGVEECCPTVRGHPDHGAAWSRPWSGSTAAAHVALPNGLELHRTVTHGTALEIGYEVRGPAGARFVHAVHALLDLSTAASLQVPHPGKVHRLDEDGPPRPWPAGLDRFGSVDRTAVAALLPGCRDVTVVDRAHALRLRWSSPDAPDLCSLLLWRNLGGWPTHGPYRSIGVEPMVGRAADLGTADAADCVRLPTSGRFRWTLRLEAFHTTGAADAP